MAHPVLVPIYEYYVIDEGQWRFQYSASPDIKEGWKRSGIAFFAFTSSHPGVMPIYQYHAEDPWRYQYSKDPDIQEGWIKDYVAFYAYTFEHSDALPIHQYSARDPWRYQYQSSILGPHPNPTTGLDWLFEGNAFYCYAASSYRFRLD
jgi:outer membrane receptor for Fe3+-dicitrate